MAIPLEELQAKQGFTTARPGEVHWLPEPARADRRYTMISVDDHIVEPPDAFEGRLPAAFAERAPRVVERADGSEAWVFEGQEMPNVGFNAVVGVPSPSTASSRRASTRCVAARGTSAPGSATWISTASTRRCASRPSCPGSRASACTVRSSPPVAGG